ncbi:MAG: zinc D-Ala-D-Ala dipeptidase [Acidobacteriota bacterium]|jgi:D-alanyl-D-alanine dipeptidase|nr:zinc D-Ala-D-Ala dipeptidase [Acidobacteriota bacterium]
MTRDNTNFMHLRHTLVALVCALALLLSPHAYARVQQVQEEAQPPQEEGTFREPNLVELKRLDSTIKLDIRYATANNFTGRAVYTEARAFLQRPAALALLRAARALRTKGYGLAVFDGYRPWSVTKLFWDVTPADKKQFVADPSKGSRHNRGCAVDLTLYDLKTGREVSMPGEYDEMSERSHISYAGGTVEQRRLRDLLRAAMEAEGFAVYEPEWWHFDYKDWRQYPILNVSFTGIGKPRTKATPATHTK